MVAHVADFRGNVRGYLTLDSERILLRVRIVEVGSNRREVAAARVQAARQKRWVLTQYPTAAYAADAGMTLADYEAFVAAAVFLDRPDPAAAMQAFRAGWWIQMDARGRWRL